MNNEILILAVETALSKPSVALLRGSQELSGWIGESQISSSEFLLSAIAKVLAENNLTLKELDAIAVSTGPGSFTGLRVGIATAQALAFGSRRKVYGVSVFEALHEMDGEDQSDKKLCVISAGNQQIYWQRFFSDGQLFAPPQLDTVENFIIEVEKYKTKKSSPLIIADDKVFHELREKFAIEKVEHFLRIKVASDNAAKNIGLVLGRALHEDNQQKYKPNEITPQYIREVRIGRN